jgi:hypothetical protein
VSECESDIIIILSLFLMTPNKQKINKISKNILRSKLFVISFEFSNSITKKIKKKELFFHFK